MTLFFLECKVQRIVSSNSICMLHSFLCDYNSINKKILNLFSNLLALLSTKEEKYDLARLFFLTRLTLLLVICSNILLIFMKVSQVSLPLRKINQIFQKGKHLLTSKDWREFLTFNINFLGIWNSECTNNWKRESSVY